MSGVGDSSRVNLGIVPPGNATPAGANPAAPLGAGIGIGASASSPFSLGAGDPGAAGKTAQSLFSLGGIQKTGGTTSSASPAISSSILTSTVTTTSAPSFGTGGGLSFSQLAGTTTTAAPTFGSGTGFSFSQPAAVTTTSTPTFGAGSTLSFPQTPAAAAVAAVSATPTTTSSISFGTGSTLSLSQTVAATTTTIAATTTTAAPSFGTGNALSFSLPTASTTFTAPLTSTQSLATVTTGQTTLGATTTVTSSSAASASSLNFCQLEEAINKWTLELEEQEKSFMNQALQVNSWDRLLIANGEKIINLNDAVEQVKLEQKQLDHELDFILAQQRELEDLLTPLEKELETNGVSDPERESTYKLAEDLDIQLKQMSEDLKEIVEHINETNRTQDNSDPIVQIGRILNAHMNSLQWIDQNTTLIGSHLEQVSKLQEVHRRENERSFRHTYDKF